jgi:hypothetical protein
MRQHQQEVVRVVRRRAGSVQTFDASRDHLFDAIIKSQLGFERIVEVAQKRAILGDVLQRLRLIDAKQLRDGDQLFRWRRCQEKPTRA